MSCFPSSSRRRLIAAAGAVAFLSGFQDSPSSSAAPGRLSSRPSANPPTPSNKHGMVRLGGANATLFVPAGYAPQTPAPLALVLHGAGGGGNRLLHRFSDLAEQYGVVLLALDSAGRTWDVVEAFSRRSADGPGFGPDPLRIDEALKKAFAQFAIDPARIAVTGFSDGASYALSLAVYNPELFGAVLAFSPGGIVEPPAGPRSRIFISHGDKDRVIPIETTTHGIGPGLRQIGFEVEVEVFDGGHELRAKQMASAFDWWLRPEASKANGNAAP